MAIDLMEYQTNKSDGEHVRNDLPAPAGRVSATSVSKKDTYPRAKHQL
jgi:hypothetical protein